MKVLFATFLLATTVAFSYEAPLGKLLARRYPTMSDSEQTIVLIKFADKGNIERYRNADPSTFVTQHSLKRRATVRPQGKLVDEGDYPVNEAYLQAVAAHVMSIRHELKWFNAVSAIADRRQIDELRALPFVSEVELVGKWRKAPSGEAATPLQSAPVQPLSVTDTNRFDYGSSLTQLSQIDVPALHNLGIYGQDVVIGVFDNGFRNPLHQAFDSMQIIATHDFVDHKVSVVPNNTNAGFGSHGVWTLSTIGGFRPGSLIGPAFRAKFILARTENDSSETPIEEDNWAAALQWADSIGVDVTSTSLGYLTFDAPYTSLTWQDMNGSTALITNAADYAVSLGIVVVNSAGNEGAGDGTHNTLIAPADGDSVITAGAVTSTGARASFSSIGPTTDIPARIKPDIMAMGVGTTAASSTDTVNYVSVSGTSFSCPLSAGVAALIRCSNPSLTPMQVRDAMRETASMHNSPGNYYGWGILDALAAANYFGILPLGKIHGVVYNDLNGNGFRDVNDSGMAGVVIHCIGAKAESTVTDVNGAFVLDSLPVGSFTISETIPPNYYQSAPGSGTHTFSLLFKADTSGIDFGNYTNTGAFHGVVFNDTNANGVRDAGEPGLAGWKVSVSGPASRSTVTDTTGAYSFTGLPPGTYAVSESLHSGWAQSLPAGNQPHSVNVTSILDSAGIDFGVAFLPAMTYSVTQGWNLLSLPQDPASHEVSLLYPGVSGPAFSYNGTYQEITTVPNGIGYWLRFASAQTVTVDGAPRNAETIPLETGWNLIGSLSSPVPAASVVDSAGIIESPFFYYSSSYVHADTLLPSFGYWVKALTSGTISFQTGPQSTLSKHAAPDFPAGLDELTFTDAAGRKQTLFIASPGLLPKPVQWYQLPPLPPDGAFDVRFASGEVVAVVGTESREVPIRITSQNYPVSVQWKVTGKGYPVELLADGTKLPIRAGGSVALAQPAGHLALSVHGTAVPDRFALGQNYPNPFNPTTVIWYQIPTAAHVRLAVFDVLGREVATLVNEGKDAGAYTVTWDASGVPSGVYFYRLNAGSFSETKKLLLLR